MSDSTLIDGNTYYAYDRWEIPAWHQEEPEKYALWRRWRYEMLSPEFHEITHYRAEIMWKQKRPWWGGLADSKDAGVASLHAVLVANRADILVAKR